ncbi:MAG: 4-diphosphocytidyl-2-C-methyl-D-erythritol kinase [Verrucomicrobiota bacterium]|jgi:4-diphosphocytidyl-2-C-methyl-D-erythritol kinase
MPLIRSSPCKVNLLLNILGRRPDGFHDLETLFHPVPLCDELTFELAGESGIHFTCDHPELPTDRSNLVVRAAEQFLVEAQQAGQGIRIHLTKRIPLAAGLGGGSSNAAQTLVGLNELLGQPLTLASLDRIAATLGSDVNFFLQDQPARATGRGERVEPLAPFDALRGRGMILYHPGFGISTAWAYRELAQHPEALNGRPGRVDALERALRSGDLAEAGQCFYNSLEAPALHKYPILDLYQRFLRENGAWAALMSGSGSTTFALFPDEATARAAVTPFEAQFGTAGWMQVVCL